MVSLFHAAEHTHTQATISAEGWQRRLNEASTEDGVVVVVEEFLALLSQEEIAQVPEDCRPGVIDDAARVNSYALQLARQPTIGIGEFSAMHRMTTFFIRAALRIVQIREFVAGVRQGPREGGRAASRFPEI